MRCVFQCPRSASETLVSSWDLYGIPGEARTLNVGLPQTCARKGTNGRNTSTQDKQATLFRRAKPLQHGVRATRAPRACSSMCTYVCVYIYIYIYMYIHIYIYIYIYIHNVYTHVYIYIYIERERELVQAPEGHLTSGRMGVPPPARTVPPSQAWGVPVLFLACRAPESKQVPAPGQHNAPDVHASATNVPRK